MGKTRDYLSRISLEQLRIIQKADNRYQIDENKRRKF